MDEAMASAGMGRIRKALVGSAAALALFGGGSMVLPTEAEASQLFGGGQSECSVGKRIAGVAAGTGLGFLLGNEIGGGSGKDLARVVLPAVGGVVGNWVTCRAGQQPQRATQHQPPPRAQPAAPTVAPASGFDWRADAHRQAALDRAERLEREAREREAAAVAASARRTAPPPPRPAAAPREEVRKAQSMLVQLGYSPGVTDGLDGPHTRRAVHEFQTDIGVTPTGRVTGELLWAMDARLEQQRAAMETARLAVVTSEQPAQIQPAVATQPMPTAGHAGGSERLPHDPLPRQPGATMEQTVATVASAQNAPAPAPAGEQIGGCETFYATPDAMTGALRMVNAKDEAARGDVFTIVDASPGTIPKLCEVMPLRGVDQEVVSFAPNVGEEKSTGMYALAALTAAGASGGTGASMQVAEASPRGRGVGE